MANTNTRFRDAARGAVQTSLASTRVSGKGYDKDVVGSAMASKQRNGFGLRSALDHKSYGSANAGGRGQRGPALGC